MSHKLEVPLVQSAEGNTCNNPKFAEVTSYGPLQKFSGLATAASKKGQYFPDLPLQRRAPAR